MDKKSVLALFLTAVLLLFVPAAAAAGGVTVELTTDQAAYTGSEPIAVALNIRNGEDQTITDITVELTAPEGYVAIG